MNGCRYLDMSNLKNKICLGLPLIISLVGFPQISETIYTPALPEVARALLTHPHLVELTLTIYFLGFAVGVGLWGVVSDWIGRRKAMLIGLFTFIVSCLACSLAREIESLLLWRFIQALGASVGSVITQTMLRDLYDGKERSKIFAVLSGALAFSPAVGPFLGGYISEFAGWEANFWFLFAMGVVLFIWSFKSLPETRPAHVQQPKLQELRVLIAKMFSSQFLLGHVLLIGATNGILFGFYEEAPFVFIEQMGIRPSLYGLLGIIIALGTIVAARASYFLSDHYSGTKIIQFGAILSCVGSAGLIVLQSQGLLVASVFPFTLCLCCLFVIFIGVGLIIPNSLSIALKDYQSMVGTAGSIFGATYYLLVAFATWAMSMLHNGSSWPLPIFLLCLGCVLVLGSRMVSSKTKAQVKENC